MKRIRVFLLLFGWLLPLASNAQSGAVLRADFDPANGLLPQPINLGFLGSQDGTLNIQVPADDATFPIVQSINKLDGWSTSAPIGATFSNGVIPVVDVPLKSPIDPASIVAGESVRMFVVDLNNPFVTGDLENAFVVNGVIAELVGGEEFVAELLPEDPDGLTVVIRPLTPLEPKTSYMVVMTDAIRALIDGSSAVPDRTYFLSRYRGNAVRPIVRLNGESNFERLSDEQANSLAALQPLTLSQESAATAAGVPSGSIILSWTFTTQSVGDVLGQVERAAQSQPSTAMATGFNTSDINPSLPGLADIFAGSTQVPYYLEGPSEEVPDTIILNTQWRGVGGSEVTRYNPVPVKTRDISIPVLITVPNGSSGLSQPPGGWPVVIFQHGVTEDRTNLFGVADTLAAIGYAAVAIDLPLHGITDTTNPLYAGALERHFNADLLPPAGIDPSGIHFFFNPLNLVNVRDNFKQAVADLFTLTRTVPTIDIDNDGFPDFDGARIDVVAHSFGAGVAVPYLVLDPSARQAVLGMPVGGIAQTASFSGSQGPLIEERLAQLGIFRDTPEFEAFFDSVQTMVDSVDAINYAERVADLHPILLTEVIAPQPDGSIPDGSVPNFTPVSPVSGTDPLAAEMGLRRIDSSQSNPQGLRVWTRFIEGDHGSFLTPVPSAPVYLEIQGEIASFLTSNGTSIEIANVNVVEPQNDEQ